MHQYPAPVRVLGVDGCKGGWVAVALEDGHYAEAWSVTTFSDLVDDSAIAIGVDIPLGETRPGEREAEAAAKEFLGRGQKAKVFTPPPLAAASATTFAAACEIAIEVFGKKITQQAWHLLPKMLDVAPHWRADSDRIREVHPECSFRALNGGTIEHGKKSWGGLWDRVEVLRSHGIEIPRGVEAVATIAPDDILDAAAVAWTAHRLARGEARSLPEPPERDVDGRSVAIWY